MEEKNESRNWDAEFASIVVNKLGDLYPESVRARGKIEGHPIHLVLLLGCVAFWVGAIVFLVLAF